MGIKKNLKKLLKEPTEMRIDEIKNVLLHFGFILKNIKGSHYTFAHPRIDKITVPVHNGKAKKRYLEIIKNHLINNKLI